MIPRPTTMDQQQHDHRQEQQTQEELSGLHNQHFGGPLVTVQNEIHPHALGSNNISSKALPPIELTSNPVVKAKQKKEKRRKRKHNRSSRTVSDAIVTLDSNEGHGDVVEPAIEVNHKPQEGHAVIQKTKSEVKVSLLPFHYDLFFSSHQLLPLLVNQPHLLRLRSGC